MRCIQRLFQARGCVFATDSVNETADKRRKANGIIEGSPTYWGDVNGSLKAYLDPLFYSDYDQGFAGKVAALVVVARRSGRVPTINQLTTYLILTQAGLAPSRYRGLASGLHKSQLPKMPEVCRFCRKTPTLWPD